MRGSAEESFKTRHLEFEVCVFLVVLFFYLSSTFFHLVMWWALCIENGQSIFLKEEDVEMEDHLVRSHGLRPSALVVDILEGFEVEELRSVRRLEENLLRFQDKIVSNPFDKGFVLTRLFFHGQPFTLGKGFTAVLRQCAVLFFAARIVALVMYLSSRVHLSLPTLLVGFHIIHSIPFPFFWSSVKRQVSTWTEFPLLVFLPRNRYLRLELVRPT